MIKFNIEKVDNLIGGGLEGREVLFLYGPPNSGKSLLAYQLAVQHNSVYINTEIGSPERFDRFLRSRYGKNFKKPYLLHGTSLRSLAKLFGLDLKLIVKGGDSSKGGKLECEIKDLDTFYLLETLKERKSEILVVDSLTAPIKGAIGTARQNFGARANVISRLMGQIALIIDETKIPIVITAHQSQDKTNKYDAGRIWGGETVGYNAKFVVQMTSAPNLQVETEDGLLYKRIRRRRYLGMLESSKWEQIQLKKDFGFI